MKSCFIITMLILAGLCGSGQKAINADRPDQSDGTHCVEKKHFQVETGMLISKQDATTNEVDNMILLRYGISKRFELRLQDQYTEIRDGGLVKGFQAPTLSFKNLLWRQHGLLPKVTLVSYFQLPVTLNKAFKADHFGYAFTIAMRHKLNSKLKFYSNIGIKEDQQTTAINYLGTAELNYNVTDKFSAFAEYFGNYAPHNNASNGLDAGFIYNLKNNFAVDLAFGSPTYTWI